MIQFDAKRHIYTIEGKVLTSVTQYLKRFQKPFDKEYWSEIKANERGITVDEMLAEWAEKGRVSREKGTMVHSHIEQKLQAFQNEVDFVWGGNFYPEIDAFNSFWKDNCDNLMPVQLEMIVGDKIVGLAGTFDALFYNKELEEYQIFDWKTGKEFSTENRWQNLLIPFDDYDDCKLNQYSLQLSLYKILVHMTTEYQVGDCYIVYLSPEGKPFQFKAVDFRDELNKLLTVF